MNNSILETIKKLLGIGSDYEVFDQDIIMHINSVFMVLTQLGVGPENGYAIKDYSNTWDEFLIHDQQVEAVKTYVYMRVRMMFDPPSSSAVMESMERTIHELEWRLNVAVDHPTDEELT